MKIYLSKNETEHIERTSVYMNAITGNEVTDCKFKSRKTTMIESVIDDDGGCTITISPIFIHRALDILKEYGGAVCMAIQTVKTVYCTFSDKLFELEKEATKPVKEETNDPDEKNLPRKKETAKKEQK